MRFEEFARTTGPRLRAGLVAAYGPEDGADAASEALSYGWRHWDRVGVMDNPAGYLYRVGQSAARRAVRRPRFLPAPAPADLPHFEPGLLPALESLSEQQRVCVVMIHGFGWGQTEVAELFDISPSSVRTHLARGLARLREALEVDSRAN